MLNDTLMSAINNHRNEEVVKLLNEGADPNYQKKMGNTALTMAVSCQNFEAILILLKAGADPNRYNGIGETPLITAAGENNYAAINLLLPSSADVSLKDRQDSHEPLHYSPLSLAAGFGYIDSIKSLIKVDHPAEIIMEAIQEAKSSNRHNAASMLEAYLEEKLLSDNIDKTSNHCDATLHF